jgi:predicted nucleic acid-binding protein
MNFLDASIFLVALGAPNPQRAHCMRVLALALRGKLPATTSTEVVRELVHAWGMRGRKSEASNLAREILRDFPDILPITPADISSACDLMQRHPGLHSRDAIHIATMLNNGIQQIISLDQDFDSVQEISRLTPAAAIQA